MNSDELIYLVYKVHSKCCNNTAIQILLEVYCILES